MPNEFLDKTCRKKFQAKKGEDHHRLLHIQNSLGTKFEIKLKN